MATLWETITGNSTLPVQAGVNFWDHLNNQDGGGGGPTQLVVVEALMETNRLDIDATVEPFAVEVDVDMAEYDIEIDEGVEAAVEISRTETVQ